MPGPDVFDQLKPAKWRDIEFPVTKMRVSIAHDLVEHKYWGVDGARVESTGLAPLRFSFSVPLLNGIKPGPNEKWGELYPAGMRQLFAAFQRKDKGMLQHPEFGLIVCKAERFDMDWDANRRGGVDAELSFVQTRTDADEEILDSTPIKIVDLGELDSETTKADLKKLLEDLDLPLPPYLTDPSLDLETIAQTANGITDYTQVLSYRVGGAIEGLKHHVKQIKDSADAARTPKTWQITRDAERVESQANKFQEKSLQGPRQIATYEVKSTTTLAGVLTALPAGSITDLIKLNPGLMRSPEVARGTIIRYYVAQAA